MGTAVTDGSGRATLSTVAPTVGAAYTATVTTTSGGCSLTASFLFTVPAELVTIPGELPATGSNSSPGITLGGVLLLVGIGFVSAAALRRRPGAHPG
jgi:LPXTG-motif cell wall-anchored protein